VTLEACDYGMREHIMKSLRAQTTQQTDRRCDSSFIISSINSGLHVAPLFFVFALRAAYTAIISPVFVSVMAAVVLHR